MSARGFAIQSVCPQLSFFSIRVQIIFRAGVYSRKNTIHVFTQDKEYPVKLIRMNDLKKEIETLTVVHDDEKEELETIIGTEIQKMHHARNVVRNGIIADVTDEFLGQMHPTLQEMALQNMVMRKVCWKYSTVCWKCKLI